MNPDDVIGVIAQALTTSLAVATVLYGIWRFFLQKPVSTLMALFNRVGVLEDGHRELKQGINDAQSMNRDAFKDIRQALTEESEGVRTLVGQGQAATISRLDKINGSVGRHEGRLHEHDLELARIKAKDETAAQIYQALNTTARIAGQPLTLGNPPPEEPDQGELV